MVEKKLGVLIMNPNSGLYFVVVWMISNIFLNKPSVWYCELKCDSWWRPLARACAPFKRTVGHTHGFPPILYVFYMFFTFTCQNKLYQKLTQQDYIHPIILIFISIIKNLRKKILYSWMVSPFVICIKYFVFITTFKYASV